MTNKRVRYSIWANRFICRYGRWRQLGHGVPHETDNADHASDAQIAIDANGNALAVSTQSDGTRNNIWANRYTIGTGWGTAALIQTDNARSAGEPQIAFDANGNALAVWSQFDGTRSNI